MKIAEIPETDYQAVCNLIQVLDEYIAAKDRLDSANDFEGWVGMSKWERHMEQYKANLQYVDRSIKLLAARQKVVEFFPLTN